VSGHCEVLDVDGYPIRVQLTAPLTDQECAALVEFARLVRSTLTDKPAYSAPKGR